MTYLELCEEHYVLLSLKRILQIDAIYLPKNKKGAINLSEGIISSAKISHRKNRCSLEKSSLRLQIKFVEDFAHMGNKFNYL